MVSHAKAACYLKAKTLSVFVFFRIIINAGFRTLFVGNRSRSAGQRITTAASLREGDDVADRVGASQDGCGTIPTESDASMRRSAVLEGFKQEAELVGSLFRSDAEHIEHTILNVIAVDTDGTAAHFVTVAHDVVGIGHGVFRILVEGVDPILGRHGERVMHGGPLGVADRHIVIIRIVGGLEQREVHDPSESELLRIQQAFAGGELHTHGTQQQLGGLARTGGEEDGVAFLGTDGLAQAVALLIGQVLGDGALELAVFRRRPRRQGPWLHADVPNPAKRRTDDAAWRHRP